MISHDNKQGMQCDASLTHHSKRARMMQTMFAPTYLVFMMNQSSSFDNSNDFLPR